MKADAIAAVVAGGLGTDIFGTGLERLVGQGELGFGGRLHIGAGGKSRNMAEMLASLLGQNKVAMVGRTASDPLGLWRVPMEALSRAGVNVDYVRVIPFEQCGKYPQVALIAVDLRGNNQIYVIPGINEDFSKEDIEQALPAFQSAARAKGVLALSLELPLDTAVHAIKQANACQLRVALDPGGIRPELNHDQLLGQRIYLLKPNQHEAHILTGLPVQDSQETQKAARELLKRGIENVLITLGSNGAYLLGKEGEAMIAPPPPSFGQERDETGCGDQTMAAVCAALLSGDDLRTASHRGIIAGTMQFCRSGIVPVKADELEAAMQARL